ncbi:MAG TPA: hypothetical protein VMU09_09650 [Acidimicrobiales bacterium]|nr:hypothetical protein [Acidimicrobiales bacterium]
MNDVVATQRVVADLVLDEHERRAWASDPAAYAAARLGPDEAAMVAGLDPRGIEAMALSHTVKRERFDFLHRAHHDHERTKAARAAGSHHDHDHDHDHDNDHHHHDQAAS